VVNQLRYALRASLRVHTLRSKKEMKVITNIILSFLVLSSTFGDSYEFKDTRFSDALREVVTKHNSRTSHEDGGKIHVFIDAHVDGNRKVNVSLKNMSTYRVITFLCQQANYPHVVRGNYIFILGVEGLISEAPEDPLPEIKIIY
jgi:hypothetical protein